MVVAAKAGSGGGTDSTPSYQRPYPGNCQYDWQTAADGSRCGARSAESRPGGY
ncbi:transmembrane anchored protein [Paraburkholderia sp. JPY454]|uniref:Transmembrane anchored protein n=1 Tax=Paraburkholderia youngii TaxID=2782701 RepID=A0ABX2NPK9_9BURK|nr:transmembrane anchored protein [Paraburkholderia youngii]